MVGSAKTKSIEEKVEDIVKKWLTDLKIPYYTKTESINKEIDVALKEAPSKTGGTGINYPDIKCFVNYKGRKLPVMIEIKGRKNDLEKLNAAGEVDNYGKDDLPNYTNIVKYAVNGAVHYATAIINGTSSYKETIAIGITGWPGVKNTETELKIYYVSEDNFNVPKQVTGYGDLSFLTDSGLPFFMEKLDALYLTEEEKEKLTKKLEAQIETNLKLLNQEMRDTYTIGETYRVKLISGMIIAGLGLEKNGKTVVSPLEIEELKSREDSRSHDGVVIMNTISSFLDNKDIPREKAELIETNFKQVFLQTDLYKQYKAGESRLKKIYITVKNDIVPFFTKQKYHLDFTGKLFNVLNDWVKIPDGDQNDVVLTPRYVCDLMVKLCQVDMNSYVWDYAAGSGGFLVSAMKEMIKEAEKITNREEREKKINDIKMNQLLGIELRPDMYTLAVLNMFLMGDGSTHILCGDSLKDYSGNYEQGSDKDKPFPANVFLLNPPYSADGKGFNFVKLALDRMQSGRAAVLIQENAGSGAGGEYSRALLDHNTLVASIRMGDIFCGRSSVQTAIYVFEVGHAHPAKKKVKFIDFSNDGYSRQNRKKSNQDVNLRDAHDAAGRYAEIVDLVLDCEPDTDYYTEENGLLIKDVITTKAALETPSKNLDKIHERFDSVNKELLTAKKRLKVKTNLLKKAAAKDKASIEKEIRDLNDEIDVLSKRIEPIQDELTEATTIYSDIYKKIGADWTYKQHVKTDLIPTEADFKKIVADYLSWKVSVLMQGEH